jgi:hypothetical protein
VAALWSIKRPLTGLAPHHSGRCDSSHAVDCETGSVVDNAMMSLNLIILPALAKGPNPDGFREVRWDVKCSEQSQLERWGDGYGEYSVHYSNPAEHLMIGNWVDGKIALDRVIYTCEHDLLVEIVVYVANEGDWERFRTLTQDNWFDSCLTYPCGASEPKVEARYYEPKLLLLYFDNRKTAGRPDSLNGEWAVDLPNGSRAVWEFNTHRESMSITIDGEAVLVQEYDVVSVEGDTVVLQKNVPGGQGDGVEYVPTPETFTFVDDSTLEVKAPDTPGTLRLKKTK